MKDGDEKGATLDGSSGDDDYRRVKQKRQKLKEKKKRQKAKKAEAALGSAAWLEEDVLADIFNLPQHFGYSKYVEGMYG